jgi:hypothetical protein
MTNVDREIVELIEDWCECYADLCWQRDQGSGPAVTRSERLYTEVFKRMREHGITLSERFNVGPA